MLKRQSSVTEELLDQIDKVEGLSKAYVIKISSDAIVNTIIEGIRGLMEEKRKDEKVERAFFGNKRSNKKRRSTEEPDITKIHECQKNDKRFSKIYQDFLRKMHNDVEERLSQHTQYIIETDDSTKWERLIDVGNKVQERLSTAYNPILDEACKIFIKGEKVEYQKQQFGQTLEMVLDFLIGAIDFYFKPSWDKDTKHIDGLNLRKRKDKKIQELELKIIKRIKVDQKEKEKQALERYEEFKRNQKVQLKF
jgi:hypothetical protein